MKTSTEELGKAAATDRPLHGIEVTNGGLVILGGGLPLTDGDQGVSAPSGSCLLYTSPSPRDS